MGAPVSVARASGTFGINGNAREKLEKGSAHPNRNRVLRERTDTDFVLRALLRRGKRTRDISTGAAVVPKVCTPDASVGDRLPSTERRRESDVRELSHRTHACSLCCRIFS